MEKLFKKLKLRENVSKGERLIYVVIFLWIAFGVLGLIKQTNLTQLAGYYASLTLFISTYLWGEWRRTSNSTKLLTKGRNSSREVVIYLTVLLWTIAGVVGVYFLDDLNPLTVYFSALSPFVMSYIIYKTTKGNDLPIFDGKTQSLVDNAIENADISNSNIQQPFYTAESPVSGSTSQDGGTIMSPSIETNITAEPKDNQDFTGYKPVDDSKNVEDI